MERERQTDRQPTDRDRHRQRHRQRDTNRQTNREREREREFSWHPVTTTQNLSWKNCTGFPFQNVLSIKSLVCVSVLYMVLVLLTSLNCCISTFRLVHYALLLTPACWKSNNTNARPMAFAPSLALDPTFGIHSHKTLDTAQPCHLLKPN